MILWEYAGEGELPEPEVLDLGDRRDLEMLVLALGKGVVLEAAVEAETREALDALRTLLESVGSCVPHDPGPDERGELRLHVEGWTCWRQGETEPGYFFVDPEPRPEKFPPPA